MVKEKQMKTVLSIAGSDSSGGAGIQADIKTMTMNGVYAMSVVTALTAQNTLGVRAISEVTPEFLKEQIDAVFEDIFPDSVKIGMVSSKELIDVIADRLKYYNANNIVVDPVMVSTSGSVLIKTDAIKTLVSKLLPIATLVTPNIPEAEILSDMKIAGKEDMIKAAEFIEKRGEKYHLDLKAINALALKQVGITHIDISEDCTMCQPDRFWSHRYTRGDRGSQGAIIVCKEGCK